jgi:hypothetical protein
MNLHPEQLLEILNQPGMIHQAAASFPGDQQVEIAILIGFTAGNRAKYTKAVRAMLLRKAKDFVPPLRAQLVQGDHLPIVRQFSADFVRPCHLVPPQKPRQRSRRVRVKTASSDRRRLLERILRKGKDLMHLFTIDRREPFQEFVYR